MQKKETDPETEQNNAEEAVQESDKILQAEEWNYRNITIKF